MYIDGGAKTTKGNSRPDLSLMQTKTPRPSNFKRRLNSIQVTPNMATSRAILQTLLPDIEEHELLVNKLKTLDKGLSRDLSKNTAPFVSIDQHSTQLPTPRYSESLLVQNKLCLPAKGVKVYLRR